MPRADLPEVAEFAALNDKKRRILFAIFGNALLLFVMVGGPWLRGYLRTRALWHGFARFGACLYGGAPNPEPGLGLPHGSEALFAARVIERASNWPERCTPALDALSPDEPIFLLPSVKRAEADLRAAVALVRRELTALAVRVPGERLSNRPLRAVEHLRAALSRHALAAGALDVPEAEAFRRGRGRGLPIPTRVPLYASSDARISVWGADDDLHALAVDRTGVSYVRVARGGLEQMHLPRPKLLEAFLPDAQGGLLVWAMPRARCRERTGGCANKSMGLANLQLPLSALPEPRWFGAHPAGRVDRSVWVRAGRVLVAAEAAERRVEVRELALPEAAPAPTADLPPLPAQRSWRSSASGEPWVFEIAGEPWVLVAQASEGATQLLRLTPDAPRPELLAELPAGKQAWLTGSACAGGAVISFGNDSTILLGRIDESGRFSLHPALPLAAAQAVDDLDIAHDHVRNVCGAAGASLALARDGRDNLLVITCAGEDGVCQTRSIASGVTSFAALALGEQVLVAYAGSRNLAQLRLQTLGMSGETRAAERIAGACWAPSGGMCGTPLLSQVGSRVLLGARDGTDLMVLESADKGATWEPLRGLKRNDSQAL